MGTGEKFHSKGKREQWVNVNEWADFTDRVSDSTPH